VLRKKRRTVRSSDYCHYNVSLNVRVPFTNHQFLFFRILAHTLVYRTEPTLELTVPTVNNIIVYASVLRFSIFSLAANINIGHDVREFP